MAAENQFQLLKERRFAPYFFTQFLGAFNDNMFKNALVILIAFHAAELSTGEITRLVNLSAGLFILPFFLFSALAGQFADKFEKAALMRRIKAAEIAIMTLAAVAFYLDDTGLLIFVLFLMGTQSSLFGPAKYAILPQQLKESELTGGNGLVEMGTFVAILTGNIAGERLMGQTSFGTTAVSIALIAVAVAGYLTSRRIPPVARVAPELKINWNPVTATIRSMRYARENTAVFNSILGISWFWFLGATYLTQLPNFTRLYIGGDAGVYTLLLAVFSIGIGAGSLMCERLSGGRVEIGLVPLGAIGLTLFGADLYLASSGAVSAAPAPMSVVLAEAASWRVLFDVLMLGVSGGVYIVPLYALIQTRTHPDRRSRVIASNNIINALLMVGSAITATALLSAGLSIPQLFLVIALMNAAVAAYIFHLVPEFAVRFLVWLLIHSIYRVDARALENIPEQGPAVLACNHVSFVDPLIIVGCVRRPVRFVMYYRIYRLPLLNFVFRSVNAIPIAGRDENPEVLERAFEQIAAALANGELVCVFPEGQITSDGEINPFRSGIEQVVQATPVPVVPLALQGLWGSWFSRDGGHAMRRIPRRLWSRVSLVAGAAIAPGDVQAGSLEAAVRTLRGERR